MHPFKHFKTITKHKNRVMKYCFKCGLIKQGLLHDLSKYGWTEFHNGAKYYLGTKSPHFAERNDKGYSEAWMHHKGRNKHHAEYWSDINLKTHKYEPVDIPNRYLAESVCDRIAATEIYSGVSNNNDGALKYFYQEGDHVPFHEHSRQKMEYLLKYLVKYGKKKLFKYIKKNMRNMKTDIPMEENVDLE